MASHPSAHPPSHARALVQASKQGSRAIAELLAEAATITDASFAAEALFSLSQDPRLAPPQAAAVLPDVLRLLEGVPRGWRKAEAVEAIARKAGTWRERERESGPARLGFLEGLLRLVLAMPDGQALARALEGLAPHVPASHHPGLLVRALSNPGFEVVGAKAVLRTAVSMGSVSSMVEALQAWPDDALRARLLGALHHQLGKTEEAHAAAILRHALASAAKVTDAGARLEILRQFVASSETLGALHQIVEAAGSDPNLSARVLSAAGGRADKLGDSVQAKAWLLRGLDIAASIDDAKVRAAAEANLKAGLERLGAPPFPVPIPAPVPVPTSTSSVTVGMVPPPMAPVAAASSTTIVQPMPSPPAAPRPAAEPPVSSPPSPAMAPQEQGAEAKPQSGLKRHVLALYDTYEGGLKEVHLRAIARAAPLCHAFDLDLALIGFPAQNVRALAGQAATETNIGDGGRYLDALVAMGRVQLVSCTTREPPQDWKGIGLPVATTSEPDAGKLIDFPRLAAAAHAAGHDRVCLLMGLGKRGLPASLLKAVGHHLEITGKRVSLETATAMGVLAERLRQVPTSSA